MKFEKERKRKRKRNSLLIALLQCCNAMCRWSFTSTSTWTWHALWMRRFVNACAGYFLPNKFHFVYTSHKRVACHAQPMPKNVFRIFRNEIDLFERGNQISGTTILTVHNFRFNTRKRWIPHWMHNARRLARIRLVRSGEFVQSKIKKLFIFFIQFVATSVMCEAFQRYETRKTNSFGFDVFLGEFLALQLTGRDVMCSCCHVLAVSTC